MIASARLSLRMKLGLASTKCGSSVGLARVVTDTSLPPMTLAIEPKSGVVATTLSLAKADWLASSARPIRHDQRVNARRFNCRAHFVGMIVIFVFSLKFVRTMRTEQELDLHPNRVFVAEELAVIIII